ncbi:hyaluronan-binding protein 2-like isoform X2 [Scyliorhinus canicula]|uniref:hyaluronan-binding protein 2-like isoform X2 n=1 Tax=Scyliorhinus canicula TaxID=7830 RepID=UPI0018F3C24F|nr:hyaluronan-binding protein 2-like isoform X2 [Scyliorhinus canicula]
MARVMALVYVCVILHAALPLTKSTDWYYGDDEDDPDDPDLQDEENTINSTDSRWLFEDSEEEDPCLINPCENEGTCEAKGNDFICHCHPLYIGKTCQIVKNPCKKNTCKHGECVLNAVQPYFKCKCNYPFKPPNCRKPIRTCSINPCKNGGICRIGRTRRSFVCMCPKSFTGQYCETDTNDCYEENGENYRGNVGTTEQGRMCLYWSSHLLLRKNINIFGEKAEENGLGDHRFCRNPDDDNKPWCFFQEQNGKLKWDFCAISQCARETTVAPETVTTTVLPTAFESCGEVSLRSTLSRIYGGTKTARGRHPWQASVQLKVPISIFDAGHQCGGALIAPCWVLTAAHCLDASSEAQHYQIILGKHNIDETELNEQKFDIEQIIMHPDYEETDTALRSDIALLKLKNVGGQCSKETKFVRTICLPNVALPLTSECYIAGWGTIETGNSSKYLLDASVKLISQRACNKGASYNGVIDETMICAGNLEQGKVDSCQGDSGGPLSCVINGQYQVYGIVSWGDRCGIKNKPGVYARVITFVNWIQEIIY